MLVESQCKGNRCIVFGSAPDMVIPGSIDSSDIIMCANGGARIAVDLGLSINVLATTTYLYRGKGLRRSEQLTCQQMNGIKTNSLWVDNKVSPGRLMNVVRSVMYDSINVIGDVERSQIIVAACGQDLRASTGVFLICLAIVSGANSVMTVGISLSDGHYNMPWDTGKRDHIGEDSQAMGLLGMPC